MGNVSSRNNPGKLTEVRFQEVVGFAVETIPMVNQEPAGVDGRKRSRH